MPYPMAAARGRPAAADAPFDPLSLSPALWLKADGARWQDAARTVPATADADPVKVWDDASGNANHFAASIDSARPSIKLAIQNGLPVLRFDGIDDVLALAAAWTIGTVFAVADFNSGGNFPDYNGLLIGNNGAAGSDNLIQGAAGSTSFYGGSGPFAGASQLLIDGAVTNNFSPLATVKVIEGYATPFAKTSISLGSDPSDAGRYWNGDVAEVLLFPTTLSAGDRLAVRGYLKTRYGTA